MSDCRNAYEAPDLARPDYAREQHDAQRHTERHLYRYPETKRERWKREWEEDRYGGEYRE